MGADDCYDALSDDPVELRERLSAALEKNAVEVWLPK
jgi:hypothetical protein